MISEIAQNNKKIHIKSRISVIKVVGSLQLMFATNIAEIIYWVKFSLHNIVYKVKLVNWVVSLLH